MRHMDISENTLTNTTQRALSSMLYLVGISLLVGCAPLKPLTPEEAVRLRAQERWGALLKRDYSSAYQFISPSYRSAVKSETYASTFGSALSWVAAEVVSVSCEVKKCIATIRVDAKPLLGRKFSNTISTHVSETWLLEDDNWWFFQKL